MNMKRIGGPVFVLVAAMAGASDLEPKVEEYIRFACCDILDTTRLSDEEVRRVIAEGIASDDRRIVDITLHGLNMLALQRVPELRRAQVHGTRIRPITRVPGLKQFLIDHWRAHIAGKDHEVSFDIPRPDWWPELSIPRPPGADRPDMPDNWDQVWDITMNGIPKWQGIPQILAAHWPRDPEILEIIWEADEFFRQTPVEEPKTLEPPLPPIVLRYNPDGMTLRLLDMGEFDTPEANAYREAHPETAKSRLHMP